MRQKIAVLVMLSVLALANHAMAQAPSVAKKQVTTPPYSFQKDPRPEISKVSPSILKALADYKSAAGDSALKQKALKLLLIADRSDDLAHAYAPLAAESLALSQLQNNAQALNSAAAAVDSARPDKQAAAPDQSSSTTQLVEKAGATSILALAVDSGALSQSQSGTATTLTGNLYGMYAALANPSNAICSSLDRTGSCGRLGEVARRTSISATFNLSQASTNTTTATQSATSSGTVPAGTAVNVPTSVGKLSSISAKFSLLNHFNPTSTSFRGVWAQAIKNVGPQLTTALNQYEPAIANFVDALQEGGDNETATSQILTKLDADAAAIVAAGGDESGPAAKLFADDLDLYYQTAYDNATQQGTKFYSMVSTAVTASNALRQLNNQVIDDALGNMLSLEYDYIRKPQQPDIHNFIFIWGNAPGSSSSGGTSGNTPTMFSANFGVSIYGGAIPAGAKYGRLHTGQAAAEFDFPFNLNSSSKNATFTLASYWQYQPSASVLTITQADVAPGTTIPAPTSVLVGTAGNLYVAQAKITLKGGKSGVDVPLGFKWSNKTDLLSGSKYAGQFGISYDFSSISSLFWGGAQN